MSWFELRRETPEKWLADFYLCRVGFDLQVDGGVRRRAGGAVQDLRHGTPMRCSSGITVAQSALHYSVIASLRPWLTYPVPSCLIHLHCWHWVGAMLSQQLEFWVTVIGVVLPIIIAEQHC